MRPIGILSKQQPAAWRLIITRARSRGGSKGGRNCQPSPAGCHEKSRPGAGFSAGDSFVAAFFARFLVNWETLFNQDF